MALWPQTVMVSYSKILAKFIGVNHFLNQNSHGKMDAKCPCCPHPDETTEHIILCQNTIQTILYHDVVDELGQCMNSQRTDPLITTMVSTSLGWILAKAHDRLGWRDFAEGCNASKYQSIQCRWYQKIELRQSSQKWAANFITQLIKITNLLLEQLSALWPAQRCRDSE